LEMTEKVVGGRRRGNDDGRRTLGLEGRQGAVVLGTAGVMHVGGCSGSTCRRGFLQRGMTGWSAAIRQRLTSLGEGLGSHVREWDEKDHIARADLGSVICDGNCTYQRGLAME
jgi:hypothetical protein